ncbi:MULTISPECIES: hypothetical protein [Nocardiopsis]|uniref:Uncharacterized protein n=1 Tax=Nocardiopsis sinuspersici TaxID=501010 RepID=A0A1V3C3R3_9ACTN|nr:MULTISPECIES: hypothetical protein [Nocardiopsis]NYH51852.1 hypothetical protein [Nocardiopsis sinuspersici]OOC55431.1 hypothetical protein NOSIN_17765 [Nocardiopsis sinuspersici]
MDTAAELESGAGDRREQPASSATAVSPVQQLSLWPPPRSSRHNGRRRRQVIASVAISLAVLLAGGGATAWALLGDDAGETPEQAAAPAEEFVGSWAGEMVQVDTEGDHVADWHAEVRIEEGAERGSTAWTTFSCSGTLTLSAGDNNRRVYVYTETADPEERCVDEAELTVWPVADRDGLRAEWSSITREGTRMISTGDLS